VYGADVACVLQEAIAIVVGWITCVVLTETEQLPNDPSQRGYGARTDIKTEFIAQQNWIFIPQPGPRPQTIANRMRSEI